MTRSMIPHRRNLLPILVFSYFASYWGLYLSILEENTIYDSSHSPNYGTSKEETKTVTTSHRNNNRTTTQPVAILHVGVHETATSTIQHAVYDENSFFLRNNIFPVEVKADFLCDGEVGERMENTPNCQQAGKYFEGIFNQTGFLQKMERHARNGEDVIVSNEFLGVIRQGGCNHVVWDYLRSAFLGNGFDTTVVVGYRRYFEWVLSYYHQQARTRHSIAGLTFPAFLDYADEPLAVSRWRTPFFSVHPTKAEIELYRGEGFEKISIFNIHDIQNGSDVVTGFICTAMAQKGRGRSDLCHGVRNFSQGRAAKEKVKDYFSRDEEYYYLLWGILGSKGRQDCWYDNECLNQAKHEIKRFNEFTLNQTILDLPRSCISEKQADRLLNISLEFERDLLPNWYESPEGEAAHREKFDIYLQQGNFCSLDVQKVLHSPVWHKGLMSIIPDKK